MIQLVLLLTLVVACILALFGAQNTEAVTLHFLWFTARAIPASLAILGGAISGAILSLLAGLPGRIRQAQKNNDLLRQNARLEKEIAQLQSTSPASDPLPQS